ncbi:type VII secretion protein EccE [Amycolatopsis marina]|uniref:type VII secretion protein EccE n=1 Tax=Amycolatopsis marina TaxID=490629 RepID=UPI001FE5471B|nr:type VII secretion protein EccE [Amycolatopsis marina]
MVTDSGVADVDMWFRRRRRPGFLGPVGVSRLLVFEIVQVVLLFVVVRQDWARIAGVVIGVLAVVVAFGRSGGRWWTERFGAWLRFRRRRGVIAADVDDPRLAALRELAPDLVVEDVDGPAHTTMGLGADGAGWFTVLEVVSAPEDKIHPPVPLAGLVRLAADAEQPGVVMQVVSQSEPSWRAGPASAGVGAREVRQVTWVSVRLDAELVAESVAGTDGADVGVPVVLAELTRRTGRVLKRRGLPNRVLDADGVLDALARSCALGSASPSVPIREEWTAWHSTGLSHACFWLRSWPGPDRAAGLLAALRALPAARVTVTFLLEPAHQDSDIRCLVRVSAPASGLGEACETAMRLTRQAGGELFRLDGEQAAAVYATAPTGGGAR